MPLGASSEPLRGLLRPLGGLLGPAWRSSIKKEGGRIFQSPLRSEKNLLLDPSWAALRVLLGAFEALLAPSWDPLGALLGHLGAILGLRKPIGSEKSRSQKTLKNTCFF